MHHKQNDEDTGGQGCHTCPSEADEEEQGQLDPVGGEGEALAVEHVGGQGAGSDGDSLHHFCVRQKELRTLRKSANK